MSSEYEQLAKQLTGQQKCQSGPFQYIEGKAGNNTIILLQCGIGKVNAATNRIRTVNFKNLVPLFMIFNSITPIPTRVHNKALREAEKKTAARQANDVATYRFLIVLV